MINSDGMTMQEIAIELGITRQRVDQIQRKAFAKMKRKLASYGIYQYSDICVGEICRQLGSWKKSTGSKDES